MLSLKHKVILNMYHNFTLIEWLNYQSALTAGLPIQLDGGHGLQEELFLVILDSKGSVIDDLEKFNAFIIICLSFFSPEGMKKYTKELFGLSTGMERKFYWGRVSNCGWLELVCCPRAFLASKTITLSIDSSQ